MRATGSLTALLVAALSAYTVFTVFSIVTSCSIFQGTDFYVDVPSCSGASCSKMAYPYPSAYSLDVGDAWNAVNSVRRKLRMLDHLCGLEFYDENGNPIVKNMLEVSNMSYSLVMTISSMTNKASRASTSGVREIVSIMNDLNTAGIEYTTEPEWSDLYNDIVLSLEDLNEGKDRTELGRAFLKLRSYSRFPGAREHLVSFLVSYPLSLMQLRVPVLFFSFSEMYMKSLYYASMDLETFVNVSVGQRNSVLSTVRSFKERFLFLKEETDKKAEKLKEDFYEQKEALLKLMSELRDENLAILASFVPSKTYVGELRVKLSLTPSFAIAKINGIERNFRIAYHRYAQNIQFLRAFEEMKENYSRLSFIQKEAETFTRTLEEAIGACITSIKAHRFSDSTFKHEAAVYLSIAADRDKKFGIRIRACERAHELKEEDEVLGNVKRAYEKCEQEFKQRWGYNPPCRNTDAVFLYECCKRESERMENAFLSSEEYLRFTDLYATLEYVLIENGLSDLLIELYSINRRPKNYEELHRSFSKLLSLLKEASKDLSFSVRQEWKGHLSTDAVSTVELLIENPLPIPVEGKIAIPFDYLGFTVDGNGVIVRVDGEEAFFKGRGSARILFQAVPVELKERILSYRDGYVEIVKTNTLKLPVKAYIPEGVLNLSTGAYYSDGYVYLPPYTFVVVKFPVISVDTLVEGNNITFVLRNTASYSYKGTISLPIVADKGPSYCALTPSEAVCKVNLAPGEEKILKFTGRLLPDPENLTFTPPDTTPKDASIVEEVSPEIKRNDNVYESLLDVLENYWKRAEELNAVDVLPFDEEFLRNLKSLNPELRHVAVSIIERLDEEVRAEAEARTKLLEKLAERTNDPQLEKLAAVAKKSLLTGDYVLPLVLSRGLNKYVDREQEAFDLRLIGLLIGASLAVYVYAKRDEIFRRRKRRIPRF